MADEILNNSINTTRDKFMGFILLSKAKWSKAKFFEDLKDEWNIDLAASNVENASEDSIVYADYNGMRIIMGLIDEPVIGSEAEYFTAANYMWREAGETVAKHRAHVTLTVMGDGTAKEKAELFVKAAASALKQYAVLGFYYNGIATFEPKMYRDCAQSMREGLFPLLNTIWFGLHSDGEKKGVYTYGMRQFGKEELEIYGPFRTEDLPTIRQLAVGTAAYILEKDVTVTDGGTIGATEDAQLPVTISPAVAFSGNSVKIDIAAKK